MEWQVILALVILVPFLLIPVLFVWYLNIGGVFTAIKERRIARRKVAADAGQQVPVAVKEQTVVK